MGWLLLETAETGVARVVAWRPHDGALRILFEARLSENLRATIDPAARWLAAEVQVPATLPGRNDSRLALVDITSRELAWLPWSVDPAWRIGAPSFSPGGRRLAIEGAFDGVPRADIYVFDLTGGDPLVCAGVGNPARRGSRTPVFVDDGNVLYLRNTRGDDWEICLLDLGQPAEPDANLPERVPGARMLTLTEGACAMPDGGLAFAARSRRFYFAAQRASGGQFLRFATVGGELSEPLRTHTRVEGLVAFRDGAVYLADDCVWRADTDSAERVYAPQAGARVLGLCRWGEQGVAFGEQHHEALVVRALEPSGEVRTLGLMSLAGRVQSISAPQPHPRLDEWLLRDAVVQPPPELIPSMSKPPPAMTASPAPHRTPAVVSLPPVGRALSAVPVPTPTTPDPAPPVVQLPPPPAPPDAAPDAPHSEAPDLHSPESPAPHLPESPAPEHAEAPVSEPAVESNEPEPASALDIIAQLARAGAARVSSREPEPGPEHIVEPAAPVDIEAHDPPFSRRRAGLRALSALSAVSGAACLLLLAHPFTWTGVAWLVAGTLLASSRRVAWVAAALIFAAAPIQLHLVGAPTPPGALPFVVDGLAVVGVLGALWSAARDRPPWFSEGAS